MTNQVDLGFLEDCESWQVESRLFPSKFGGKPAWLDLHKLPNSDDLQCGKCKQPMIFLCQIYAPYENDDKNFHRTLFLFICKNSECCIRNNGANIKVFRSSLERKNDFYPFEPPNEEKDSNFALENWLKLCKVCGSLGEKMCSNCKAINYCSREHQVVDWKEGHKLECGSAKTHHRTSKLLFPEKEIVMEPEELEEKIFNETAALEEYEKLQIEGKTGTMSNIPEEELESHANANKDKVFSKFKKIVKENPDQILRYERGGSPLWIAEEPTPKSIPDCEYCGGCRQFEFQIMPQTLAILNENDLDWGVIVVYSCKQSCTNQNGYKQEFVFKQDVTLNDL